MQFRSPCLLLLLLSAFITVKAQTSPNKADSIRRLISTATSDTARASLYIQLTDALVRTDSAGAFQAAEEAIRLQNRQNFRTGIARSYFNLGRAYHLHGRLDSGEAVYQRGLAAIEGDTGLAAMAVRAKLTGNLGQIYGRRGMAEKEMEIIISVLPMLEKVKDTLALAVANFNIGVKLFNGEQYKKAYSYMLRGIAFHRRRPSPQLTDALLTAATNAVYLDSTAAAHRHLDEAAPLLKGASSGLQAQYHIAEALTLHKEKQYAASEKAARTALKVIGQEDLPRLNTANALDMLNDALMAQGNYTGARKAMEEYLAIARSTPWPRNVLHGLQMLAGIEEKTGNAAASLRYLREYVQKSDSMKKEESDVRLGDLEMKYQASEKEKKILALQNESKEQQLTLQRSRNYNLLLLAGLLVATLTALLVFVLYRNKNRAARQQQLLQRQELENVVQAQRLNSYSAMLEGQEMERKRLARDLHDGLGGTMATIRLKTAELADGGGQPRELHRIVDDLDGATRELRRIAHNMMPETLLKFGLEAALEDLCRNMQRPGISIVFQAYDMRDGIAQARQIMIYRLAQELLTNALKHAGAENILVQCIQREGELSVTVEDDGRGFDAKSATVNGMGLQSVRARTDYLKGRLDIQSEPGTGTTVNITIHVQQPETDIRPHY